jgi:hypothetical protein
MIKPHHAQILCDSPFNGFYVTVSYKSLMLISTNIDASGPLKNTIRKIIYFASFPMMGQDNNIKKHMH